MKIKNKCTVFNGMQDKQNVLCLSQEEIKKIYKVEDW